MQALRAATALLTSIIVLTACGAPEDAEDSDDTGVEAAEMGHVHDIVNADGRLLLGTHSGLFDVDPANGSTRLVGTDRHDLMAFAVRDGVFLASGHPDLFDRDFRVDDKPPLLGLITSEDGGRTWEPRSLLGAADFHALTIVDGSILGLDGVSERLLRSRDGVDWESLGAVSGQDLAADPDEPQTVVAVTYDGALEQSTDGGASWSQIDAPELAAVEWTDGGLVGLGPEGSIHSADGPNGAWSELEDFDGSGEALLVTGDTWYVALEGPTLMRSTDEGRTWTTVLRTDAP